MNPKETSVSELFLESFGSQQSPLAEFCK